MRIQAYNLRAEQETAFKGEMEVHELIRFSSLDVPGGVWIPSQRELASVSHIPQRNPLKWEKLMTSLVFSVSGKLPFREEIKRGRQIYEALPRQLRKSLTPEVVFGFFPYIISAFKINIEGINRNGTNSLENMISIANILLGSSRPRISSFLCAHKERRDVRTDTLRPHIKSNYAIRAINLMNGILKNSPASGGIVEFGQGRGNSEGMNAIFPQIFLKYVDEKRLKDLGDDLERHFLEMSALAKDNVAEGVQVDFLDISRHYAFAEAKVKEMYGKEWRDITGEDLSENVVLSSATKDLGRLVNFSRVSEPFTGDSKLYINLLNSKREIRAVQLFQQNALADIVGRAALDCAFYYVWGEKCKEQGAVAIGLDVDHDSHQSASFSLGYSGDKDLPSPIAYARKEGNGDKEEVQGLNNLSIRQFWR